MFQGAYTALITPFSRDGAVDYGRLRELVEFQIAGGIDGLVPVGTTGESPTLDAEEHVEVIRVVVETAAGRVKVIAGTGANSTAEALELTARVKDLGVDGTLQVTPYYNKPTQTGLLRHFSAVADLGLPVILYNVPGRSACEIAVPTVAELGVNGVNAGVWFGAVVKAGTPATIVQRLNQAFATALKDPDVLKRFNEQGMQSFSSTPEEFGKYMQSEQMRWSALVKASGASID